MKMSEISPLKEYVRQKQANQLKLKIFEVERKIEYLEKMKKHLVEALEAVDEA